MDAKQACDKLNGFNFQNRYLVGTIVIFSDSHFPQVRPLGHQLTFRVLCSIISPAREDGQVKRGLGGPQGEFRTPQEATRHRLTFRRAR